MSQLTVPKGYKPLLSLYETQVAIGRIKRIFEDNLGKALNLKGSRLPLFLPANTGITTMTALNALWSSISRRPKPVPGRSVPAKWKRLALHKYGFQPVKGYIPI